jgi:RimJ/RimL family protein N-acetyltransferase
MNIHFDKANIAHKEIILDWLQKPHVQEFWDNSQECKDDVLNFINGRKDPSPYFNGVFEYWVGYFNQDPYSLILTSYFEDWGRDSLSSTGRTVTLDFAIGNLNYLGQGLAAPTLQAFMDFYRLSVDPSVTTFFIDPDIDNIKAQHVYKKAGFRKKGRYKVTEGYFSGHTNLVMIRKFSKTQYK